MAKKKPRKLDIRKNETALRDSFHRVVSDLFDELKDYGVPNESYVQARLFELLRGTKELKGDFAQGEIDDKATFPYPPKPPLKGIKDSDQCRFPFHFQLPDEANSLTANRECQDRWKQKQRARRTKLEASATLRSALLIIE